MNKILEELMITVKEVLKGLAGSRDENIKIITNSLVAIVVFMVITLTPFVFTLGLE